ncbi:hypothetical protein MOQ72_26955 [Saccharopolyspora sp. K220]|uniref:hypothetical protein n=1 Tax=Saccharopolyspora soli TaxID=2926618 RepID=UPI001F59C2A4|nr:hypothetical protein [Saccharopolyspora soli]MCI2421088.1 hypothetical protein [Saccharopolyspora soli]
MTDEEVIPQTQAAPPPDPAAEDPATRHVRELTRLVSNLSDEIETLTARVTELEGDETKPAKPTPAPWVWFSPPAAAEDPQHRGEGLDPRFTVDNFVAWYNTIYVGAPGTTARPIPACWRDHPALPMEIATLAYSWRQANLGRTADARDAQYWHHAWRPGFAHRMVTEWTHPRCLDGDHQPSGAPPRPDRFTTQERNTEESS